MKKRSFVFLLFFISIVAAWPCFVLFKTISAAYEYKLASKNFVVAVNSITPAYFFDAPIVPPDRFQRSHQPYEGEDKAAGAEMLYSKLTDKACKPLADAIEGMMKNPVNGQGSIFEFTEEITKVMRNAGAYALPIRLEYTTSDVRILDPSWDPNSWEEIVQRGLREYLEKSGYEKNLNYIGKGQFSGMYRGEVIRPTYQDKYRFLVEGNKYKLDDYSASYYLTQTYLFVLRQNTKDINSDRVYLYVDIPYGLYTSHFGQIDTLTNKVIYRGDKQAAKVRCYSGSKSGLVAVSSLVERQRKNKHPEKFYSFVDTLPPLTMPLNKDYLMKGASYDILANQVSQPYLRCWLSAFKIVDGYSNGCIDTNYAEEYKKMVKSDMCVGPAEVKTNREFEFPYHYTQIDYYNNLPHYRSGFTSYFLTKSSCEGFETEVSRWSR